MAEGFITRRGGVSSEQALAPTINQISLNATSITFTITNNDTETATIAYRISSSTADGETLSLAGGATSSNITIGGLDAGTSYTIFSSANIQGKIKSDLTEFPFTTTIQFISATGGTTLEYNEGGKRYKSHTFTTSGNFVVNSLASTSALNQVDYLIIAGGGGGGGIGGTATVGATGGGGAGGYRTTNGTSGAESSAESKVTVTAQSYEIIIGAGGTGVSDNAPGNNGTNSSALGISSIGGGFGSGDFSGTGGNNGGSGGGGLSGTNDTIIPGGTGTANQGRDGGDGLETGTQINRAGGGGGGAKDAGSNGVTANGGNGGDGLANTLRDGTSETRAGGGGGGTTNGSGTRGTGGAGGGGAGGLGDGTDATNATANTGSGGGGAGKATTGSGTKNTGGNGASGIVIIRYEIAPSA